MHGLRDLLFLHVHRMQLAADRWLERRIGLNIAAGGKLNITIAGKRQCGPAPLLQDRHWHAASVQADLSLALRQLRNAGGGARGK